MKSFPIIFGSLMFLAVAGCSKDRSADNNNNNNEPSGLEAFLNGQFNIDAIDYSGSITLSGVSAPLDSSGNGGSGYYLFNAADGTVEYDVTGNVKFSVLGQSMDIPVPISGTGDLEILSETRFVIKPESGEDLVCNIVEAEDNTLTFTTRLQVDSSGANVDATMEVFTQRD